MSYADAISRLLIRNSVSRNRLFHTTSESQDDPISYAADVVIPLDDSVAHFRLTAFGVCTKWYSSPSAWTDLQLEDNDSQDACEGSISDFRRVIVPLYKHVRAWNSDTISKLKAPDSNQNKKEKENLVKVLSMVETGLQYNNNTLVTWSHGLLRAAVLDQLLWASSPSGTIATDPRGARVRIAKASYTGDGDNSSDGDDSNELPSTLRELPQFLDAVNRWPSTVLSFAQSWRSHRSHVAPSASEAPSSESVAISWKNVGLQLLEELDRSSNAHHVFTARGNIIAAALGLLGLINSENLIEVRKEIRKKRRKGAKASQNLEEDTGVRCQPETIQRKRIFHSLKMLCGDSFHPGEKEQGDLEFLRELYLVVALSSVCLLANVRIKPNRRQDRIKLNAIMTALGTATVQLSEGLATIQRDMWEIIVSTALKGPAGLDNAIDTKLAAWEEASSKGVLLENGSFVAWRKSFELFTHTGPNPGGMYCLAEALSSAWKDTHSKGSDLVMRPGEDWLEQLVRDIDECRRDSLRVADNHANAIQSTDGVTIEMHRMEEGGGAGCHTGGSHQFEDVEHFFNEAASPSNSTLDSNSKRVRGRGGSGGDYMRRTSKRRQNSDADPASTKRRKTVGSSVQTSAKTRSSAIPLRKSTRSQTKGLPGVVCRTLPPYARSLKKPTSSANKSGSAKTSRNHRSDVPGRDSSSNPVLKSQVTNESEKQDPLLPRKFTLKDDGVEEVLPVYTMKNLTKVRHLQLLGMKSYTYFKHVWKNEGDGYTVRLERESVTVPSWVRIVDDLALCDELEKLTYAGLPGAPGDEALGPIEESIWESYLDNVEGAVKWFPSSVWNTKTEDEKQSIFRRHNVVVMADDNVAAGLTNWHDGRLRKACNFRVYRQAHDLSIPLRGNQHPNERIRKATLDDLVANSSTSLHDIFNVLNFLDVSLPGIRIVDSLGISGSAPHVLYLDDALQFLNEHSRWFLWLTSVPLDSLHWAIVANTSAVSTSHIDAGGFATWIHVLLGRKLWYIAVQVDSNVPNPNWINAEYKWVAVDLRKGDRLFMRPGTVHLVVTTEHCFAVGGHFFCKSMLQRTLRAMVLEHFFGKYITNTEHPTSPILLFKMLNNYVEVCTDLLEKSDSACLQPHLPSNNDLASLLLLVWNIDLLEPDGLPYDKLWHGKEHYEHDRDRAHALHCVYDGHTQKIAYPRVDERRVSRRGYTGRMT